MSETETNLKSLYAQAKITGHKKVAGEHSLTVGEIVFTILGVLIFVYGTSKMKIPAQYRAPLAIGVIFAGEWIF